MQFVFREKTQFDIEDGVISVQYTGASSFVFWDVCSVGGTYLSVVST